MKIALIGAGAVGGYFIWGFEGCEDVEFTLIADGERKTKYEQQGIRINEKVYYPTVKTASEAGIQELVLVATKYSGLQEAIALLPALVGEKTLVLSLLNGVDSEALIADKIGAAHVEYSLMRIASKRDENGITFNPDNTMGLFVGREKLTKNIIACFEQSKIRFTIEEDARTDVWIKYASNLANNLPQAVLGVDASLYIDSEHGKYLATKLWDECYMVAQAKGIDIGKEAIIFTEVPKTSKYSTLQDLEAKRHTEIEMLAGQMLLMAEELGIAVPYTDYTYHAIKALEEKNDGIIGA